MSYESNLGELYLVITHYSPTHQAIVNLLRLWLPWLASEIAGVLGLLQITRGMKVLDHMKSDRVIRRSLSSVRPPLGGSIISRGGYGADECTFAEGLQSPPTPSPLGDELKIKIMILHDKEARWSSKLHWVVNA